MERLVVALALIALAGSAFASDNVTVLNAGALAWKDNPNLPAGAKAVIMLGDPKKAGDAIVQRSKFPPNYLVPPHTHPYAESVTVIEGSIGFGFGDKPDTVGELHKVGDFFAQPAKTAHYLWTGSEGAVIEIYFLAPGGIDYVDPADDPRKK